MATSAADEAQLRALEEERAFLDLSSWRKVRVSGNDALSWLGDLLTAGIAGLAPGDATRSLLLTPTGRIRADLTVARHEDDLMLLQPAEQPEHIGLALSSYVLSSDVSLEDRTNALALFAIPGRAASSIGVADATTPSSVGSGIDVLTGMGKPAWGFVRSCIGAGLEEAGADALERWRIQRGVPRMGADFDQRSLPAEAGLDDAIDYGKGCFLGQEAVARVRNLGHPARTLRHMYAAGPVRLGEAVFDGGAAVGEVTSAASDGDGTTMIVRVRWDAAGSSLALRDGRTVIDVPRPG